MVVLGANGQTIIMPGPSRTLSYSAGACLCVLLVVIPLLFLISAIGLILMETINIFCTIAIIGICVFLLLRIAYKSVYYLFRSDHIRVEWESDRILVHEFGYKSVINIRDISDLYMYSDDIGGFVIYINLHRRRTVQLDNTFFELYHEANHFVDSIKKLITV